MKQSVISYVPMAERYDVLVLGGGTAGVMAACAAGREGKKALILEREYALGGTATLSLTIPRMTNHIPGFVSNSSLAEELQQTLEAKKEGGDTYFCDPQMQKVELEAMCAQYGVAILYGAELVSVVKTEKQIDEVIVSTRGGLRGYRADCFVDCTGDACLARRSGCKTECGYENENQPMTLRFCVGGVDVKKVEKTLLDWGYRFGGDHFPMEFYSLWREEAFNPFTKLLRQGVNEGRLTERDGSYVQVYYHQTLGKDTLWFNCPEAGHITSAADAESVTEMILYSRKSAMRIMSFLKERFPGFEEAYIQSFADIPGIRESYRLDGEYIMTEKDIEARCRFEDAVAQSAYPIDIHNEKNLVLIHMDPGEYYEIPYRCMLPREVDNLLVAGRWCFRNLCGTVFHADSADLHGAGRSGGHCGCDVAAGQDGGRRAGAPPHDRARGEVSVRHRRGFCRPKKDFFDSARIEYLLSIFGLIIYDKARKKDDNSFRPAGSCPFRYPRPAVSGGSAHGVRGRQRAQAQYRQSGSFWL